jgi:hypothetical protein
VPFKMLTKFESKSNRVSANQPTVTGRVPDHMLTHLFDFRPSILYITKVKGLSFHSIRPWILTSLHNGVIQLWD